MKRSKAYIISAAQISAQEPFCGIEDFVPVSGEKVSCKDPDFKPFIPPMAARRMSSILKRCIAVSKHVLSKASIECPDAIITGSGIGCVADTESFLRQMLDGGETLLNPSKFICSTPNTMGSQIAIALGCHGFNSTHVNDSFAFEGALMDSLIQIQTGKADNVLLCAADQMNEGFFNLVHRDSIWKNLTVSEAAEAFVLSSSSDNAICAVEDIVTTRSNPAWEIDRMLRDNELSWDDIDSVMTSASSGEDTDRFAFIPENKPRLTYKQYCGQFLSASAFGFFLCSEMIRTSDSPKRILLVGESRGRYSFTLISSVCTN